MGGGHHRPRDGVFPDLSAAQFGDDVPGGEDRHPVAQALQFPDVGGDDDHRGARVGDLAQDAVDLRPRADVDPLGGLLGQQQPHLLVEQGAGQQDLLLVAAGQAQHVGLGRRRPDGQLLPLLVHGAGLGAQVGHAPAAELAERGDQRVLPDRQRPEQALGEPVGRQVHHPGAQRRLRVTRPQRRPVQLRPPARVAEAGQRAQEVRLPVPHDSGQAHDLPGLGGQGDVVEGPGGQPGDGERRRAPFLVC